MGARGEWEEPAKTAEAEAELEHRPLTHTRFECEGTAVFLSDGLADRQAQSSAAITGLDVTNASKILPLLFGDARPLSRTTTTPNGLDSTETSIRV